MCKKNDSQSMNKKSNEYVNRAGAVRPKRLSRVECDPFYEINLFTDGACRGNPGEGAIAFIVLSMEGELIGQGCSRIGPATNNRAEYLALLEGLRNARDISNGTVNCHLDSELVVRQMREEWRINDDDLRSLFEKVLLQESHFEKVKYTHVPRTHPVIRRVDMLANSVFKGVCVET